ncbi:MAG: endolytic transglycosylase MltG [Woeseiaceae bacterium]
MSVALKIVLGLIAAIGVALLALTLQLNRFLETPIEIQGADSLFEVRPGMPFGQISSALAEQGIIDQPTLFRLYARFVDKAGSVHVGEYQVESGTTPKQLLEMLVAGDVRLYSFTIVEGWTFRELIDALNKDSIVVKGMVYEDWPGLLENLGAEASHPEGLFLPETYRFPKGTSDLSILRQAYELMQETLDSEWDGRASNIPVGSPYEALVLASIIEKETALASERPRISGVFTRRLEQRMRLQTDPTVIYGIGESFNGNLTRRDLRTDTPYNTYTRSGLPPTPIALPGKAAINAALNPEPGTEIYFVATGLGDGSHKFSNTKAEHDAAVQEYLARQRASRNQ